MRAFSTRPFSARPYAVALVLCLSPACRLAEPTRSTSRPTTVEEVRLPEPTREPLHYSAQEALRDVLSGELEYIGTGRWPGVERSRACAFRNQRVVVVNAYCTLNESHAFRIDVYSPRRGRVRIYAEANGAVSAQQRRDYFTFMLESSPPANTVSQLPQVALTMPYEDLRRYEQQRHDAYLPSCYGGEQLDRPVGSCLGALAPTHPEWVATNQAFLDQASQDWYLVVRKLRQLATRYGVHPVE